MGQLAKKLRDQNYDLIEGSVRNHGLLQVWRKLEFQPIERFYTHVTHAFESDTVTLVPRTSTGLDVSSEDKEEYKFNIGLSVLEELLETLGLGELDLDVNFSKGKSVKISYDDVEVNEVDLGDAFNFFVSADFKHSNRRLLKQLNRDRMILITGVVSAKNLKVEIETESAIEVGLDVKLNQIVDARVKFERTSDNKLVMQASDTNPLPIAVQAHRIIYHKGEFVDLRMVSDNRTLFD